MPIRKFRGPEGMEDTLWYQPGSPELARAIRRVWDFARRTCPRKFPPGVYRHRTIEEAQALRDQWEQANFEEIWRRRGIRPEDVGRAAAS